MERLTTAPPAIDAVAGRADVASAIDALSDIELVRLKALARIWSGDLPGGLGWSDILHEAIARALDGSRPWPPPCTHPGVPVWRYAEHLQRPLAACPPGAELVSRDDPEQRSWPDAEADETPDPERILAAAQALANVYRLFKGDLLALKIIAGMADGLAAREICKVHNISELDYDTTRRRMRRTLLRHLPNCHDGCRKYLNPINSSTA